MRKSMSSAVIGLWLKENSALWGFDMASLDDHQSYDSEHYHKSISSRATSSHMLDRKEDNGVSRQV